MAKKTPFDERRGFIKTLAILLSGVSAASVTSKPKAEKAAASARPSTSAIRRPTRPRFI